MQRLVERATRGPEPVGEHVDRHAVEREGDEHPALVRVSAVATAACTAPRSSASRAGPCWRLPTSSHVSGSSGTSRPCHARLRSFTAASSSANSYAQVVKRLAPRKSSSRASTLISASSVVEILQMAGMLSSGVIRQFPERF